MPDMMSRLLTYLQSLKERFLQGVTVLAFYWILTAGTLFVFGALILYALLSCHHLWPIGVIYLTWVYLVDRDTYNHGGRRSEFVRTSRFFRYMKDYYPVSLVKTCDLLPMRNYIFCYHPHGAIPEGLVVGFGSEALHFSQKFPGIVPYIAAHSFMGWSPVFREIIMALGVINVSRKSCKFVLTDKGPGHSVAIVPGGSSDVLNLFPGSYILTLQRRQGFVKLALETGCPLVPVFGFGQNDVFNKQPKVSFLQNYKTGRSTPEKWIKVFLKGVMQMLFARFGIMPYPRPITVVVGSPILVDKVENPSMEQISELHSKYKDELRELFENHRDACGVPRDTELVIQ